MFQMKNTVPILVGFLCVAALKSTARAEDSDEIQTCLTKWGKTPFTKTSKFRVIGARVKVMGIGKDIDDKVVTSEPELVFIRPAVTVMGKTAINLGNPNGWYCLKGDVAVMGKMEINVNCKAHFASSKDGATVMGSDDHGTGTTVMGSTRVNRVGDCAGATKELAKAEKEKEKTSEKTPEKATEKATDQTAEKVKKGVKDSEPEKSVQGD